jgi:hypothetical protein
MDMFKPKYTIAENTEAVSAKCIEIVNGVPNKL